MAGRYPPYRCVTRHTNQWKSNRNKRQCIQNGFPINNPSLRIKEVHLIDHQIPVSSPHSMPPSEYPVGCLQNGINQPRSVSARHTSLSWAEQAGPILPSDEGKVIQTAPFLEEELAPLPHTVSPTKVVPWEEDKHSSSF